MKNLTKQLLTATLILGLPLGVYAASAAVATSQPASASETATAINLDCAMDGHNSKGGKHHGNRHDKMARLSNMTPAQIQANLQQRYDRIEDPVKKAEFIKNLTLRAEGMTKHADAIKQFADAQQ